MNPNYGLFLTVLLLLSISSTSIMSAQNANESTSNDMFVRFTRDLVISDTQSKDDLDWSSYGPGVSTADFDSDYNL